MNLSCLFKKKLKSIVLYLLTVFLCVLAIQTPNLTSANDKPLPQTEAEQVQAFSVHTIQEIKKCQQAKKNKSDENLCTAVDDKDRPRLSYLFALNAYMSREVVKPDNSIRRLISTNENDNQISQGYNFSKAVEKAIESCSNNTSSKTDLREKQLNGHLYSSDKKKSYSKQESAETFPAIGCNDLIQVLRQFGNQEYYTAIKSSFYQSGSFPKWLELEKGEAKTVALNEEQKTQAQKNAEEKLENYDDASTEKTSKCYVRGVFALIVCPLTRLAGGLTSYGLNFIINSAQIDPQIFNTSGSGESSSILKNVWRPILNIANGMIILGYLALVTAYIINKNTTLTVRKTLPKLIILAILMNLSYFIIQLAADISNIVGHAGMNLLGAISETDTKTILDLSIMVAGGGLAIATVALSPIVLLFMFLPILLSMVLATFGMVIILGLRDATIVMLVMFAPMAIASLIFSGLSKVYKIWSKLLISCLMLGPMLGLLLGAGIFIKNLLFNLGGVAQLFSPIPLFAALIAAPKIVSSFIINMPLVGSKLGSIFHGSSNKAKQKLRGSSFYNRTLTRAQEDHRKRSENPTSRVGKGLKLVRTKKRKAIAAIAPLYAASTVAPTFDAEEFNKIKELSSKMSPVAAEGFVKDPNNTNPNTTVGFSNSELAEYHQLVTAKGENNLMLAAMMSMASEGRGTYDDALAGMTHYIQAGGDNKQAQVALGNMMQSYKAEGKIEQAALIKELFKTTDGDFKQAIKDPALQTTIKFPNVADRQHIIAKEYTKTTNWKKFRKPKAGSDEDIAFRAFATNPDNKNQMDNMKRQIADQNTLDYLATL